jgi:glycosidase
MLEEGACQAGCPGTHAYLHEWAEHVHSIRPDAWTVGEAWGNIAMVLPYYPDQLTSYFGFELADSLLRAVNRGTVGGMLSGYLRLQDTLPSYRWSPFLSNHDQTRVMTTLGSDPAKARVAATLLLTLPGLPFVYYGEELGMTGAKPDPQLRTPMQWSAGAGVGFTTGTPWESPNADAPSVNAAAQESDRGSLLNLYRRLIHLRKQNVALATGRLVQLTANDECIVTYLRREGHHAVFVIENLGAETASSVTISSSGAALPPGTYAARNLLGDGANGAVLRVGPDGQIRDYRPGTIGPRQSLVFDLIRR